MTRLIALGVAATVVEVVALVAVVHTLLRHAMTARGLPSWRVADTLLTSPLLWLGAALAAGALNWLVAGGAARAGRADGAVPTVLAPIGVALVGAAMAWFGMRAVGKLY